jgi:hypothetical protein
MSSTYNPVDAIDLFFLQNLITSSKNLPVSAKPSVDGVLDAALVLATPNFGKNIDGVSYLLSTFCLQHSARSKVKTKWV